MEITIGQTYKSVDNKDAPFPVYAQVTDITKTDIYFQTRKSNKVGTELLNQLFATPKQFREWFNQIN